MRTHSHNALHIKKALAPIDYRRDPNCTIVKKNGDKVVLPAFLIVALREGKVKVAM